VTATLRAQAPPARHRWAARRWSALAVAVLVVALFAAWALHRIGQLSEATQATNPIMRWEWLFKRERTPDELMTRFRQHLELTVVPVALGLVISSALAALVLRFRWLRSPVFGVAGFLYTIPSLALFGVLVTFNTNWTAALIALTSYTLLVITRNIVAGIDGVPKAALDAADGLGMSRLQRLVKVDVPLALPVILTGVRVATVTTVGLVGISAVIQLGGLAYFIFDGFGTSFTTKIVVGSVGSVLIAIALDVLLRLVERVATPWTTRRVAR